MEEVSINSSVPDKIGWQYHNKVHLVYRCGFKIEGQNGGSWIRQKSHLVDQPTTHTLCHVLVSQSQNKKSWKEKDKGKRKN